MRRLFADTIALFALGSLGTVAVFLPAIASDNADSPTPPKVATTAIEREVAEPTDPYAEERAAVGRAMEKAAALGFEHCTPMVVDIHFDGYSDDHAAAWAAWPEMFGYCAIGVVPDLEDSAHPHYLDHVAEHEVCHLVTGEAIASLQEAGAFDGLGPEYDPYHEGLFTSCVQAMEESK